MRISAASAIYVVEIIVTVAISIYFVCVYTCICILFYDVLYTARSARRAALPVLFLLTGRFFASQMRPVAPIKLKFGREERTIRPLTKFTGFMRALDLHKSLQTNFKFVNAHLLTVLFMVCCWPHSQQLTLAKPHLWFTRHGP